MRVRDNDPRTLLMDQFAGKPQTGGSGGYRGLRNSDERGLLDVSPKGSTLDDERSESQASSNVSRKKLGDKIACAGRHVFVAALSGLRCNSVGPRTRVALPLGLRENPTGSIPIPYPLGDDSWDEVFRDLTRVLHGGGVHVLGKRRIYAVRSNSQPGVCAEARSAALEELSQALRKELQFQGQGIDVNGLCVWDNTVDEPINPLTLGELALRVARHISVGPSIQFLMERNLKPALWQPFYAICVAHRQVRVLTMAFIGDPVMGDRPDRKRTPFCLRLASENLAADLSVLKPGHPRFDETVWYGAEAVGSTAETTFELAVGMEEELFSALERGSNPQELTCRPCRSGASSLRPVSVGGTRRQENGPSSAGRRPNSVGCLRRRLFNGGNARHEVEPEFRSERTYSTNSGRHSEISTVPSSSRRRVLCPGRMPRE